jgi:hypothetical protein
MYCVKCNGAKSVIGTYGKMTDEKPNSGVTNSGAEMQHSPTTFAPKQCAEVISRHDIN